MRPLLVANIHEIRGTSFLYAFLYDDNVLLTQFAAPIDEKQLAEKMRSIVWDNCSDQPAFDVWTNTEAIYTACLSESDMTGHFKTKEATGETLRCYEDKEMRDIFVEIYELEDPKIEKLPKWREKLISLLQKCIKLLEGEVKNGMETIR
ncbi:hypothetical protein [Bacillus thuringiensis]|nr:hypothetical protein [Bacillus thuringiensis]PEE70430.1 hypothetical protein COM73_13590 [Bacillus thuringiensis]PEF83491.1 hypothetical protein CON51_31645 [Bacillus thuringiensis]PES49938.1 hypothetical protein CN506_26075 [Bacillus thuringiensis]PEV87535.1 hypothetical protein CN442_23485 [Bacillus thuringiensis]PFK92631.1 hypothetical protein COJ04_17935 [Bacillus thuringiensis]